jgi:hypothetical protein
MFDIVILVAVGAFIGWNLPQPFWAVYAQDWFEAKWKAFKAK